MIKKLKIKVIVLCMVSLFVILALMIAGMNVLNYRSLVTEADTTLAALSVPNKGDIPNEPMPMPEEGHGNKRPPMANAPSHRETRYFSVQLSSDGQRIHANTDNISSVDAETAERYARAVLSLRHDTGFYQQFRYARRTTSNGTTVLFLDCGQKLDAARTFMMTSIGMALLGLVAAFVAVFFLSGNMIRPIAESYEKQKRFITDAGHEIKTPLTIIRADADVLEMEIGENEYLQDIQKQTERLAALTHDLVYLARMEEAEHTLPLIEFPLSDLVEECVGSFKTAALAQEKQLICRIEPLLTLKGDSKAIEQLLSILMNNALKYAPQGSDITVWLTRRGKHLHLTVCNRTDTPPSKEQLSHIFERFYRADASHNSETGGHGIGLSVAHAIVTAHGGKLEAWVSETSEFCIRATFPQ